MGKGEGIDFVNSTTKGGKGGYVGFSLIKREQRGSINYISFNYEGWWGGDFATNSPYEHTIHLLLPIYSLFLKKLLAFSLYRSLR